MTAKVSIIVPIYNVERYLSRCLDSVLNQTCNNFEIICVNDASPDNCHIIAEKYAENDKRIKIITHKENKGLSAARHTGLGIATGEYIYFLDSDDWISENFIEKMVEAAMSFNQNAVCCTNILTVYKDDSTTKLLKRDFEEGFFPYYKACQMAWSWLLKKSFLDKFKIVFPFGLKYEDAYFFNVLVRSLENVYIINSATYYHLENEASIMGSSRSRIIKDFDIVEIIKLIYEYYKANNLLDLWTIPFFYLPKYMLNIHENKPEFFRKLKILFKIMEKDVLSNKNLYSAFEIEFFNKILLKNTYDEFSKDNISIISALKRNIKIKGATNGKNSI